MSSRFPPPRHAFGALLTILTAISLIGCASDRDLAPSVRAAAGDEVGAAASALVRVARGTRDAGDLPGAVALFKRAHDLAPGRTEILIELAQTLSALGAHNEAADSYRKALEAEPKNPEALRSFGNTLIVLNQPKMALEQFHAALAQKPDARIYNGLGVAHDLIGDHATAQASYRSGLTIAPNDAALRNNMALSLALAGQYEPAIALLTKLVNEPHATTRQRQNLALVYGLAGRAQDAAQIARIDYDEQTVQNNLAYYEVLRGLPANRRAAAIFGVATLPPSPPPRRPEPTSQELGLDGTDRDVMLETGQS